MKKTILFICVPCIILLFTVLNAIMLYKPVTNYKYTYKDSEFTYTIKFSDDTYSIKKEHGEIVQTIDYGYVEYKGNSLTFNSENSGSSPNIQVKNIFSITYNNNNFSCPAAIVLEVIYSIFILAGFATLIILLVKYKA